MAKRRLSSDPSRTRPPASPPKPNRTQPIYPQRAARIRALGALPEKLDFGPPSPELVAAIVTGTGPMRAARSMRTAAHAAATTGA